MDKQKLLAKLPSLFGGQAILNSALKGFMPNIISMVEDMKKPVADGGMLEEGEQDLAILVGVSQGELVLSVVGLTFADGKAIATKKRNISLNQMMDNQNG